MHNPNFKETNKILIEDYKEVSDILVYKLKNISNAFYIACSIRRKKYKSKNIVTKQSLSKT